MEEIHRIEFNNPLINRNSLCWERLENGDYILNVIPPQIILEEDFDDYLIEESMRIKPLQDKNGSLRDYWARLGYTCSDEEWEEYMSEMGNTVWPPNEEDDLYPYGYYEDAKHDKKVNNTNKIKSTKYINGIEVDDEEFEAYNNKVFKHKSTRRGGKKHHKKRVKKYSTRRYDDDDYYSPFEECTESIYYNEEKHIIFYRDLTNTADTYEWTNIHEFNAWLEDNDIDIDECDISNVLYSVVTHCCLNPDSSEKKLIIEHSYGDLVWEALDGDESRMSEINDIIMRKSCYL